MCGIAGVVAPDLSPAQALPLAEAMVATLVHRGPDSTGSVSSAPAAFAVRRLEIVAPGLDGQQPRWSPSGRYLVACNGEVYDSPEVADELAASGRPHPGRSDTAVLAAALDVWGIDAVLERVDAMFGLAVWDAHEERLHLARDRFGEKPLYWAQRGRRLYFGSELRAVLMGLGEPLRLDLDAAHLLVRQGYVPAPYAIAAGVQKLAAGANLSWQPGGQVLHGRHYDLAEVAAAGHADPFADLSEADVVVEDVLRRSVRRRLLSDVPLGVLLSGGVDSSLVLALAAEELSRVPTFTVGFDDADLDERVPARAVAEALGAEHHELVVSDVEAAATAVELAAHYDEPLGDPSQVPTLLVAGLARQEVTVALGGDGGDELFAGYHHHVSPVPDAPRSARTPWGRRHQGRARLARELRRLARWPDAAEVVPGGRDEASAFARWPQGPGLGDHLSDLMLLDAVTFLPDDVLTKADRACMAVSLENRTPYLSAEVAAAAWRIPATDRVGAGGGKAVLRRLLAERLAADLVDRPKQGFNPPIDAWLRGPLRGWAEGALAEPVDGLDLAPVRATFQRHAAGEENAGWRLWPVLVLADWWHCSPLRSAPGP